MAENKSNAVSEPKDSHANAHVHVQLLPSSSSAAPLPFLTAAPAPPTAPAKVTLPPLSAAIRDTTAAHHFSPATSAPLHPSSSSIVSPTWTSLHHAPAMMMDVDSNSVADDRSRRATSVLSMDDLEAAQALEGLRSGTLNDSVNQPRRRAHCKCSRIYILMWCRCVRSNRFRFVSSSFLPTIFDCCYCD